MHAERVRALLLALPYVDETMQWGENLVFWVGSKAEGGRMFALLALDAAEGAGGPMLSFAAGSEGFAELLERDGVVPAPYLARAHWVAVTRWDVFSAAEWPVLLRRAHELVLARLTRRTRAALELRNQSGRATLPKPGNEVPDDPGYATGGAGASRGKKTPR